MFLETTRLRNPKLIQTGVSMHQQGVIPPNTYLIDLDIVQENVQRLSECAGKHGMTLYFMSKQLGRLPYIGRFIHEYGIDKAVAVDFDEAKTLAEAGVPIGNIGHLVQPGKNQWNEVLSWKPEVITLFSSDRARQLSDAAIKRGVIQDVILRVYRFGDEIFPGQEGGFLYSELNQSLSQLLDLKGIRIMGVTTFPNLKLSDDKRSMESTPNLSTLRMASQLLEERGISVRHVNGPSATSCATIPYLVSQGVTHGEPGHALTGTTPLHAYRQDLPERPAIVYVTEVSHSVSDRHYVIGGGYYGRSRVNGCLAGSTEDKILHQFTRAFDPEPGAIDYYGSIAKPAGFSIRTGDTAVFAFRTQVFVTRAHIALVRGIQSGTPKIVHFERKW